MQRFVGVKITIDPLTQEVKERSTECVANDRFEAARKMNVPIKTVCLDA